MSNRLSLLQLPMVAPLLALGLLSSSATYGQTRTVAVPRVQGAVDPAQTIPLKANILPVTKTAYDQGALPDGASGRMMVVLQRSPEQEKALNELLAAQKDPKSALYKKWLTPEQFGATYGVADADVQAVTGYLSAQGFQVGRISKNKMTIEFSGTAGQVRSSFGTEIHSYALSGRAFTANASVPQIPQALAPVVRNISGLSNYRQATSTGTTQMVRDGKTSKSHPLYADQFSNPQAEAVSPGDLAVIYDIPTSQYDGTGVTVGIIGDANVNLAIPASYRTTFGLPDNPPTVVVDGLDPGITADSELMDAEIELVAATAPAAKVYVYTAADTDLDTGLDFATLRALDDNVAQVLIFGFENCEANMPAGLHDFFNALWEQAAAQGMSVIVTSGSGGAAGCDAHTTTTTESIATQGLAVNGFATTPFNTAVGATDFFYGPHGAVSFPDNLGPFLKYWSEDNSTYVSALSYIPEQPFNSSNEATNQVQLPPVVVASGGGFSSLTGSGAVVSGQSVTEQPAYQSRVVAHISESKRVIPDVSIYAGNNNGSTYILCLRASSCVGGSPTTGLTYDSAGNPDFAAAAFGGVAALLVQAHGPQGNLNPNLYAAAFSPNASLIFHDVANGTNQVQCASGSLDCVGGLTIGYVATPGFDAASGLGSADVGNLIKFWPAALPAATVTLSFTKAGQPITGSFVHDDPTIQLNVSVTGSSSTPTGDVSITTSAPQPSSSGIEAMTLANGQATDPGIASVLPGGTYTVTARYAGDSNYGPATASTTVSVGQITSALKLLTTDQFSNPLPVYSGQTFPYGTRVQFTFQVTDANDRNDPQSATGYVILKDFGGTLLALPLDSEGFATYSSDRLTKGSHNFTATYSGDATFTSAALTGGGPTLVIASVPTVTTVASTDPAGPSRNGLLVATVTPTGTITPTSGGNAPVGTVQFFSGATLLGSATLNIGNVSGGNPTSTAIFGLPRTAFPSGVSAIDVVATYVPDSTNDYLTSSSAPLHVGAGVGINTTTKLSTNPAGEVSFLDTSSPTFDVTVVANSGGAAPTGNVTFFSNGTVIGQVALVSGAATFTINPDAKTGVLPLPLGQSYIIAQYDGDATHSPSTTSNKVDIYDELGAPDFSMQANETYQTISPANTTATFHVQFTSLNRFGAVGDKIALSYVAPPNITCSNNPAAPTFANIYSTLTVTCAPTAGTTVAHIATPSAPRSFWLAGGGTALACMLLFGMPARRRAWQSLIAGMALVVVAFGLSGCGATVANGPLKNYYDSINHGTGGTLAKGTYTVVVIGTSTVLSNSQPAVTVNLVHNVPLKIIVQ